ncbi:MAG: hypothetical protein PV344_02400, partial [Anaplasma sp.]|nr:hypothetical protein [Anaplasma sp.]
MILHTISGWKYTVSWRLPMRKALLLFTLVLMKISSGAYGTSLEEALDKTLNNNLAIKANMYKTKAKKREVANSAI